jgi:Permuted papain-like amidase enzyme, YaeF/YiiX, C92 family
MNSIIKQYNLKPGDRIVVPKSGLRVIQHHAIYLGQNNQGVDLIAENKIGHGVRLITANEFFEYVINITSIERFAGNNYERQLAVQKALQKLGKPYDLINYNCENFATEIQTGVSYSEQVVTIYKGVAVAAGFTLLFGLLGNLFND